MNSSFGGLSHHHALRIYRQLAWPIDGCEIGRGFSEFAEQFRNSLDTNRWNSIWAVTLTLKQVIVHADGTRDFIDLYQCRKNFRQFMRRLGRASFGSAAARRGKRLRVIPVHEKSQYERFHSHAALEGPRHLNEIEFSRLIRTCWVKTPWSYRDVSIRPSADRGWVNYLLKPRGKSGLELWSDCIDWDAFHNPTADA